MKKLLLLFDYVYYRIYKFSKERGDNTPGTNGTLILTLIQCFTVIDLMIGVQIAYDYPFPNKLMFLPLIAITGGLNWYRYERNFNAESVEQPWRNEDKDLHVKNGWLIGSCMAMIFLIPFVYGYLRHNLKII